MNITSTEIIWQSDRFEMPLRTLTEDGHLSELRNIVIKKPQAALFEPLSGYSPANNMMAVMGMDFLGGQNPESGMDEGHGTAASRKDSSEPADGTFKMPDSKKRTLKKPSRISGTS